MSLLLPTGAPFSVEQQAWLNGFFAGLDMRRGDDAPTATLTVEVLYGTQTGNSADIAEQLAAGARGSGLGANVAELDTAGVERLRAASHVVIVTSTYGEGEMPDDAELFWEALEAEDAPRLEHLRYAVLALGDSGYDDFCQAGRLIDLRLEQLGAVRFAARVDCDVDFDEPASAWTAEVLQVLSAEAPAGATAPAAAPAPSAPARARSPWNRRTPYASRLAVNRVLSAPASAKEIRHYEFELGDSGIAYAAGDALAVVPENDPQLADAVIAHLGLRGDDDAGGAPLAQRMNLEWEIRTPSKELIAAIAERDPESELAGMVRRDDRDAMDSWLWGRDVLDLLEQSPGVRFDPLELAEVLRPLQARAYSISSSPLQSPDRIHLTVASVRHGEDRVRGGVCSTFLADRLSDDDPVGIFPQPNAAFSVPDDGARPIIMVGPGTGVAPFRGFLYERAESGATGGNWLFFGDQHRATDFIYEDELLSLGERGVLTRLDLAFSRDQAEKVYVQTRMREKAAELYAWLEDGAHFYVCGDASRMAKDVEQALVDVIASQAGVDDDGARDYLARLKREKRYVRDVY
ncbi:sulfite reductase subunit alpha [Microbacterium gilvum]|uniref:Sulfite reductase subunit alpha n=1 Tax=Microbacterium gilvum TaxID=1336204 RepID=A0ABP9AIG9_9MICO